MSDRIQGKERNTSQCLNYVQERMAYGLTHISQKRDLVVKNLYGFIHSLLFYMSFFDFPRIIFVLSFCSGCTCRTVRRFQAFLIVRLIGLNFSRWFFPSFFCFADIVFTPAFLSFCGHCSVFLCTWAKFNLFLEKNKGFYSYILF